MRMYFSCICHPIAELPPCVLCPTVVGRVFDSCRTRVRQLSNTTFFSGNLEKRQGVIRKTWGGMVDRFRMKNVKNAYWDIFCEILGIYDNTIFKNFVALLWLNR